MLAIRHAVKLQHRDSPRPRLVRGTFEIVQRPVRPRVARRWNQERMVYARFVGKAASPFVRMLRRTSTPGKVKAKFFENGNRAERDRISRESEADGSRDAMLCAASVDGFDLLAQLSDRPGGNTKVVSRVVAD